MRDHPIAALARATQPLLKSAFVPQCVYSERRVVCRDPRLLQTPRAMFIIELTYKVDLAAIDVCAKTLRGGDVRASQHATGLDALFATEVAKTR